MKQAEIGDFGGSGFYRFLDAVEEVAVETPYGKPSAPFVMARGCEFAVGTLYCLS